MADELAGMNVTRDGEAYGVRRETREAAIEVKLDLGTRRDGQLATGLAFFDHMLEMLGWWGDLVVDARYESRTFRLTHVICEDIGLALGRACAAVIRDRIGDGVESSGFAHAPMDEASAFSQISFEGRSHAFVTRGGAATVEHVEDMLAADLVAFFEGFSQGGRATLHLRLENAADAHHAWEAGFRAFARALRAALKLN